MVTGQQKRKPKVASPGQGAKKKREEGVWRWLLHNRQHWLGQTTPLAEGHFRDSVWVTLARQALVDKVYTARVSPFLIARQISRLAFARDPEHAAMLGGKRMS